MSDIEITRSLAVDDIKSAIRDQFISQLAERGHFVEPFEVEVDLSYRGHCRASVRAEIKARGDV